MALETEARDDGTPDRLDRRQVHVIPWTQFGPVLKEGLHFDPDTGQKLNKLLRYESAATGKSSAWTSTWRPRPAAQPAIYYVTAPSRAVAT